MSRETEEQLARRKKLVRQINSQPLAKEELAAKLGEPVYDHEDVKEHYTLGNFLAPFVCVTRLSDGAVGSMLFQHAPRLYFSFKTTQDDNKEE